MKANVNSTRNFDHTRLITFLFYLINLYLIIVSLGTIIFEMYKGLKYFIENFLFQSLQNLIETMRERQTDRDTHGGKYTHSDIYTHRYTYRERYTHIHRSTESERGVRDIR